MSGKKMAPSSRSVAAYQLVRIGQISLLLSGWRSAEYGERLNTANGEWRTT